MEEGRPLKKGRKHSVKKKAKNDKREDQKIFTKMKRKHGPFYLKV